MSLHPEIKAVAEAIEAAWDCPEEDDTRIEVYAKAAIRAMLKEGVMKEVREELTWLSDLNSYLWNGDEQRNVGDVAQGVLTKLDELEKAL